jgi:outer membrane protein assembly factor BamB
MNQPLLAKRPPGSMGLHLVLLLSAMTVLALSGCQSSSLMAQKTQTSTPPSSTTEPAGIPRPIYTLPPSPVPTEQKRHGVLWTRAITLPPKIDKSFDSIERDLEETASFFIHDGTLYCADSDGYPLAVRLDTGEEVWRADDTGIVIALDSENVYVTLSTNSLLYTLDSSTGQRKWITALPHEIFGPLSIIDDVVYVSGFGGVAAIDRETGGILWSDRWHRTHSVTNHTVLVSREVIGTGHYEIAAIDIRDGSEKWSTSSQYDVLATFDDQVFYERSEGNSYFFTVADIDTGEALWSAVSPFGERSNSSITVEVRPNALLINYLKWGSGSTVLLSDRQTGETLEDLEHDITSYLKCISQRNGVFVWTDRHNRVLIATNDDGRLLWQNIEIGIDDILGVSDDNIICLGWRDRSHYVFAIDPETGDIAWRITLKSSLLAPDPIMISDRIISLSEDSRTLLVYGVANGQQISQIPLADSARLLVGYDDLLLVELGSRYERMTRPGKISVVLP